MSSPKPKQSAESKRLQAAQEEQLRLAQIAADAESARAGGRLLSVRTRTLMRLYGARRAMAGVGSGGSPVVVGTGSTPSKGGGAYPSLGGGGGLGGGIGGGDVETLPF